MFPLNDTQVNLHDIRSINKFKVNFARTKRYKNSAIPYMANLLNKDDEEKKEKPIDRTKEVIE